MKLILGSGSPRRKELLAVLGVIPDVICPPDIDETPHRGELPRPYCRRMAREKALAIAAAPEDVVLCADTTVAMGRRILGTPTDRAQAEAFLTALSGRRHRVITAVVLRRGGRLWQRAVDSRVRMKRLGGPELQGYLASEDWRGKAGAYSIQGAAGAFIPWISGSHSAIAGLPLAETAGLLQAAGWPVWGVP
ncbi:MAG: septum formation protein Maf [Rhodobacteraceae bacterium]|nr:septum formation protein Maf [Paracoccaceae bacterium]